jgi:hypothetical protein
MNMKTIKVGTLILAKKIQPNRLPIFFTSQTQNLIKAKIFLVNNINVEF